MPSALEAEPALPAEEPALPALVFDPEGADARAQALPFARAFYDARREAIRQRFLEDGAAFHAMTRLSQATDILLTWLLGESRRASALKGGTKGSAQDAPPFALIAVGGYGRGQLYPHSDVDLLFLCDADAALAREIFEPVLYVLWDLGLTVGHAVRTPEEMRRQLEDDTILASLLDARLVAGNPALFAKVGEAVEERRERLGAGAFVQAKMRERDLRHKRGGDSRYLLEPNVKDGKGGLRDLHTLYWIVRYACRAASVRDLVAEGKITEREHRMYRKAHHFLSVIRIHLHYLAGRAEERLTFDMQRRIAESLGYRGATPNQTVERFMKHYFRVARDVGYLTGIFCAVLEEEQKYVPRYALGRLWTGRRMVEGFPVSEGRLRFDDPEEMRRRPARVLALFYVASRHTLDAHPRTLQMISRNLRAIGPEARRDPEANALFLEILLDAKRGAAALRGLKESGVLARFIPEFANAIGQMQFDMYHIYTVDEHIMTALDGLHAIERGEEVDELPLATSVMPLIASRRVLHLGILCHDIAKGKGNHAEHGAVIARRLAARFGFSPVEQDTVEWLVRHHGLFSEVAFKRDLNDHAALELFVREAQSLERLRLLLVLTVADIRAVGPNVWNGWKGALMRELYAKAEHYIQTGVLNLPAPDAEALEAKLRELLPGWESGLVRAYLSRGFPDFWQSRSPEEHAVVAGLLREIEEKGLPCALHAASDTFLARTMFTVCAPDRRGLMADVAGAISLAGANILGARIFTLKDGWAVQTWQLQSVSRQALDKKRAIPPLLHHVKSALAGTLDPAAELHRRHRAYPSRRDHLHVEAGVVIENKQNPNFSIVEVTAPDSVGLLHAICRALQGEGVSIHSAHINTYGEQAVDVFYVKDAYGLKITHGDRSDRLREAILDAIAGIRGGRGK